jgi:hypothetical protein
VRSWFWQPGPGTAGILANIGNREGILGYLSSTAARSKLESDQASLLNSWWTGLGSNLATLEKTGASTGLVGLADKFEKLKPLDGDSQIVVAGKLADARDLIINTMTAVKREKILSPDEESALDAELSRVSKAIPFSRVDVTDALVKQLQKEGKPADVKTILAESKRILGEELARWRIREIPPDMLRDAGVQMRISDSGPRLARLGRALGRLEKTPATKEIVQADVIREIARVSKRGLHAPSIEQKGEKDPSHETMRDLEWWKARFAAAAPDFPVKSVNKEDLELHGDMNKILEQVPRTTRATGQGVEASRLKKINFGSFVNMFYYEWLNTDIIDNLQNYAMGQGYDYMKVDADQRCTCSCHLPAAKMGGDEDGRSPSGHRLDFKQILGSHISTQILPGDPWQVQEIRNHNREVPNHPPS